MLLILQDKDNWQGSKVSHPAQGSSHLIHFCVFPKGPPFAVDKELSACCCFQVTGRVFLYLMTKDDQPVPDGREAGGMGEKGERIKDYKSPVIKIVTKRLSTA